MRSGITTDNKDETPNGSIETTHVKNICVINP